MPPTSFFLLIQTGRKCVLVFEFWSTISFWKLGRQPARKTTRDRLAGEDGSVVTWGVPDKGGDSRKVQARLTQALQIVSASKRFSWVGSAC